MMHFNTATKATLQYLLTLDLPESTAIAVEADGSVSSQCPTQDAVRRLRAAFGGGVVWHKGYVEGLNWWEYNATLPNGIRVHIYACREAPPTCTAIVETYEEDECVPVQFETRRVTKERVRWDCSGAPEVQE